MEKEIRNYRTNLITILICYILTIVFNLELFSSGFSHFLYGISMFILGGLTIFSLIKINENIILSAKIAIIIGPIMSIMSLIEGFNYSTGFIQNFRVLGWIFIIDGISIFLSGRKLIKNIDKEY